jgi:CRISPR-associated protein Cas1
MPKPEAIHGPRRELIDDAAVFERVVALPTLESAWSKVLANGGAGGGDGMTLARFQVDCPTRLVRLREALMGGTYRPHPLRHVDIPKRSGGMRPLAIPSVVDRVEQTAVALILAPLLDEEFEESSFAYRAGRSVRNAVERVRALRAAGHVFLVDADLERFFENVPHDQLIQRLGESMTDGPTTQLIGLWLEHAATGGRGLPQGSPISPLLANLHLDRLDEAFAARGARIVRFADDFVILCESRAGAEAALTKVEKLAAEHGVSLNRDKTRVTSFDQGFRFLGHLFVRSMVIAGERDDDLSEAERNLRDLADADRRKEAEAAEAAEAEATQRRHGLDPEQRILYVVSADRRLSIRNQAFSVEAGAGEIGHAGAGGVTWREILALPHDAVDRIELGPHAMAEPAALRHALATDTPIAFVNGHGETLGWLAPRFGPRAGRHLAQARHALDPALRLALARKFVEGRIRNHRALLRRLNRDRGDPLVLECLTGLNASIRRLGVPATLAELMGHEGHAAALFWPAFGRVLGRGFTFTVRRRDPPVDAVNIMLNVTASLLTRDITIALERAGLHPGFGQLHASDDGSDAAVYDLMEEFRAPLCESVVAQAINGRTLSAADFEPRNDGGLRLKSAGYAALLRVYERSAAREVASRRDGKRRTWRGIMVDQALALAAHVEGCGRYEPYLLDY